MQIYASKADKQKRSQEQLKKCTNGTPINMHCNATQVGFFLSHLKKKIKFGPDFLSLLNLRGMECSHIIESLKSMMKDCS